MVKFTVLDLLDMELTLHRSLNLRCVAGRKGLVRELKVPDINRPGLALTGFLEKFAVERVQIFGQGENAFLDTLTQDQRLAVFNDLFAMPIPCLIFTHNIEPEDKCKEQAEISGMPVLVTDLTTSEFSLRLIQILGDIFSPKMTIHGVLVEVSGMGVLITGGSGVGKSETALELIERGHRLIADDAVEVRCVNGNILLGSGINKVLGHHMEIRGLGIINISSLFGVGSVRDKKQIELIVELENWNNKTQYDRIGVSDNLKEILGVEIHYLKIPVKPGRNIPIIIETATLNERLKQKGQNSAREFNQNVLRWLESQNAKNMYLKNEKEMSPDGQ